MPKTRAQKEETKDILSQKLRDSKSVVFTDYRGMTMGQISDLRIKLREQNAEFTVTKNTLMNLALKEAQLPVASKEIEEGPTATLFSFEDEIAPIKTLVKALKDAQIGKIKGGVVDGELMDSYSVIRLSSLPGKLELRGQVVGLIASPLQGIVGVLQANLRNLVYALNQIKEQKAA